MEKIHRLQCIMVVEKYDIFTNINLKVLKKRNFNDVERFQ